MVNSRVTQFNTYPICTVINNNKKQSFMCGNIVIKVLHTAILYSKKSNKYSICSSFLVNSRVTQFNTYPNCTVIYKK